MRKTKEVLRLGYELKLDVEANRLQFASVSTVHDKRVGDHVENEEI